MNGTYKRTRVCAALAAAGWIGMFGLTGAGMSYLGNLSGVVYHLALIPIVMALPGTEWSKSAGYVWIFCDTALNVAAINGLPDQHVWALRLGVHLAAAIWIIVASGGLRPVARLTGLLLGASLALHAVCAPFVPEAVLAIAVFPLMLVWLGLVATGTAVMIRPSPPASVSRESTSGLTTDVG